MRGCEGEEGRGGGGEEGRGARKSKLEEGKPKDEEEEESSSSVATKCCEKLSSISLTERS